MVPGSKMRMIDITVLLSNRWTLGGGLFVVGFVAGGIVTWRKMNKEQPCTQPEPFSGSQRCVAGIGATALIIMLSRRYAYPNAEQMFKKVLPLLRANIEVRQSLGSNLQAGQFRAYAHTGGVCFTKALPFLSWNSRQLEMMFQVHGQLSSAMVSMSCESNLLPRTSGTVFKSLAVDMPNGERILLKGQSQDVVFKGYTRLR